MKTLGFIALGVFIACCFLVPGFFAGILEWIGNQAPDKSVA